MLTSSSILIASLLVVVTTAIATPDIDAKWTIFKAKYKKHYTAMEEIARQRIWLGNLEKIDQHNQLYESGAETFYLSENEYSDMSHQEVVKTMNGFNMRLKSKEIGKQKMETSHPAIAQLPKSVDWRKKGYVTPVKNQGACGSCYAFSATGGLEGQHFKATGHLVSLSESNLLDCSGKWGNWGCRGGFIENCYQYIIDNGGIDTEKSYPYEPQVGSCFFTQKNIGANMTRFVGVKHGDEHDLQKAVATIGPVSVAIDASHDSFSQYGGGIYDEPDCSTKDLDHAVLVVGYGVDNGTDFWLVKNSWGMSWGEEGYIRMSRNKNNQCGIATMASYPVV